MKDDSRPDPKDLLEDLFKKLPETSAGRLIPIRCDDERLDSGLGYSIIDISAGTTKIEPLATGLRTTASDDATTQVIDDAGPKRVESLEPEPFRPDFKFGGNRFAMLSIEGRVNPTLEAPDTRPFSDESLGLIDWSRGLTPIGELPRIDAPPGYGETKLRAIADLCARRNLKGGSSLLPGLNDRLSHLDANLPPADPDAIARVIEALKKDKGD